MTQTDKNNSHLDQTQHAQQAKQAVQVDCCAWVHGAFFYHPLMSDYILANPSVVHHERLRMSNRQSTKVLQGAVQTEALSHLQPSRGPILL